MEIHPIDRVELVALLAPENFDAIRASALRTPGEDGLPLGSIYTLVLMRDDAKGGWAKPDCNPLN